MVDHCGQDDQTAALSGRPGAPRRHETDQLRDGEQPMDTGHHDLRRHDIPYEKQRPEDQIGGAKHHMNGGTHTMPHRLTLSLGRVVTVAP